MVLANVLMLIGLIFLASLLTVGGLAIKQTFVVIIGAIFWFIASGYSYTQSTIAWDVPYLIFWAGMFIGVVVLSSGLLVWRKGKSNITDYSDELDTDVDDYIEAENKERSRTRKIKRLGRKKSRTDLRL